MKRILLFAICLLTYTVSRAQQGVEDTHPDASIFAINYQDGRQYPATSDQAILFKDALVDLVRNTYQSKQILRLTIGRKTAVIKQINPKRTNGYQLTWQATVLGQKSSVCTFYYNIDENNLYFFDTNSQNWVPVQIDENNQQNLEACREYSNFNSPQGYSNSGLPDLSELPDTTGEAIDAEVTANEAPPALPEYEQPECPADGYMWQPGYWAYSPVAADYYWVPGVWVAPPAEGLYWTPGYWGYAGNMYVFHVGYWGHSVGFYGGINYGFGYVGIGFTGGEWRSGHFAYNTAVVHVNRVVVHNTYVNNTVINNTTIINNNRSSFNGRGGVVAKPTQQEEVAMHDHHIMATRDQIVHQQAALGNKDQFAGDNHGRPTVTTMPKVQPAALNKGTGPAVNNSPFRRQPVNGNQNSRPFGNNQPTNNGQQNNNHTFPNTRNTNQQQPANNGQQNNGYNRDNNGFGNAAQQQQNNNQQRPNNNNSQQNGGFNRNNNQQQPINNSQQNSNFSRDNRNPANTNQQPANNSQQNGGYRNNNQQQQPASNGQQNGGFNRNNNQQQQPANNGGQQNNGQQNHGFNHDSHNNSNQQPAAGNTQGANGGNQQNRNQGQPQPANNNGQQNNNQQNHGDKPFNNKPVNQSHQIKPQPKKKDDQ